MQVHVFWPECIHENNLGVKKKSKLLKSFFLWPSTAVPPPPLKQDLEFRKLMSKLGMRKKSYQFLDGNSGANRGSQLWDFTFPDSHVIGRTLQRATCVYYHVFTNIFSQNDTGQSGGLGGESLENSFTGATSAAVFIHSLDARYLWSG